jgi:hypothetical protein
MLLVIVHGLGQPLRFAFWTNCETLRDATLSQLNRQRSLVELLFRSVKQSLRVGKFYGTSPNVVRVQLWSAICVYLAVAITRKELGISTNLTTFVQLLSVHALSPVPILARVAKLDTSNHRVDTADRLRFNDLCWCSIAGGISGSSRNRVGGG